MHVLRFCSLSIQKASTYLKLRDLGRNWNMGSKLTAYVLIWKVPKSCVQN